MISAITDESWNHGSGTITDPWKKKEECKETDNERKNKSYGAVTEGHVILDRRNHFIEK